LTDDYDLGFWNFPPNDSRGIKPAHARHGDVHEHDIRLKGFGFLNSIEPIRSFPAD
jgi:hypothetical protein